MAGLGVTIHAFSSELSDVVSTMPRDLSWNPGIELAHLDMLVPAGTVLVAKDASMRVVGMVSGHRQGDFGWVGLYIVRDPAMRGRGIGMRLWRAMMDGPLRGCTTMGLDGVAEQQANYMRSGFTRVSCQIIRHAGVLQLQYPYNLPSTVRVTGVSSLVDACVEYDAQKVFPDGRILDRRNFMRCVLVFILLYGLTGKPLAK